MKVRIKRQDDRRSAPYWQVFHFRGEGRITVAAILEKLNERDQLEDIKGKQCRKIRWECGCMQKMCGGCAMVINGPDFFYSFSVKSAYSVSKKKQKVNEF